MKTLERSVLKFSPNIVLIKASYQALGQVCKFVLGCKKFCRIGPRVPNWPVFGKAEFQLNLPNLPKPRR